MAVKLKDIYQVYVEKAARTADFVMPANHYHPYYELYFLTEGRCRFFVGEKIYTLHKGDMLMISPGDFHHTYYFPGEVCERITIYFKPECLLFYNNEIKKILHSEKYVLSQTGKTLFPPLLNRMLTENKVEDSRSDSLLRCYLTEFLLLVSRYRNSELMPDESLPISETEIANAIHFICNNYRKTITLTDVAEYVNLSPSYLSRKFKAVTGLTFKEYINGIRLKQASILLLSTSDSITDIALNCGYNDSNYFKDLFKKTYGMSPRAFRKS